MNNKDSMCNDCKLIEKGQMPTCIKCGSTNINKKVTIMF